MYVYSKWTDLGGIRIEKTAVTGVNASRLRLRQANSEEPRRKVINPIS